MSQAKPEVIALYGSLMRGLGAMSELGVGDGLVYLCPAVIPGELFDLGSYPGLKRARDERGGSDEVAEVVGELYSIVDAEVLKRLDAFEGVVENRPRSSLYLRERIRLLAPAEVEAWVYFYNRPADSRLRIPGGDWRTHQADRLDAEADSPAPEHP